MRPLREQLQQAAKSRGQAVLRVSQLHEEIDGLQDLLAACRAQLGEAEARAREAQLEVDRVSELTRGGPSALPAAPPAEPVLGCPRQKGRWLCSGLGGGLPGHGCKLPGLARRTDSSLLGRRPGASPLRRRDDGAQHPGHRSGEQERR